MSRAVSLCFPYGSDVECSCGARGRILRCRPLPLDQVARPGPQGDGPGQVLSPLPDCLLQVYEELGSMLTPDLGEVDESTELLLAATFLLIVILTFIG